MIAAVPEPLRQLARLLPAPLYVVGGYVRNALLWGDDRGTDVDICGAMAAETLSAALEGSGATVTAVNPRVGTVLVRYGGGEYEYTTFRRDSYPIGGAHSPSSVVFVDSLEEDALRRDFRVNAIYLDVATGEVIDPLAGMDDLREGLLRTTRAAEAVFAEDGLRILRLARFAAELGFRLHPDALDAAMARRALLADISAERKREELDRILLADVKYGLKGAAKAGLDLLVSMHLLPYLGLPDVDPRGVFPIETYPPVLPVRLAGLIRGVGKGIEDVGQLLGTNGLRYPNAIESRVRRLLEGAVAAEENMPSRRWAAIYGKDLDDVSPLWKKQETSAALRQAYADVMAAGVPVWHKDLPLSPMEVEALGVPKAKLGAVMRETCLRCAERLLSPTREEATELIEEIRREERWK